MHEDERSSDGGADLVDVVICIEGICRHLKGEYVGRSRRRITGIQDCEGIFDGHKEGIWRRGQRIHKSSRTTKTRIGKQDDRRIHTRIQKSSQRKWI